MRVSRSPLTSLHQLTLAVAAIMLATMAGGAVAQAAATPAPAAAAGDVAEIQRLINAHQATQALKLIDDALAKNPKDPAMRFRRGVTLSLLDRNGEAIQVFQKLVEDHPEMPAPYNNLAVLYGHQGDYNKARAALVAAIRTNPQYATAYQNLGDVYAQLASEAYQKALQIDNKDTVTPPKLLLLRELTNPGVGSVVASAPTPVAAPTKPVQVAAATPAPAPAPAPVVAAKPAPAPAPAPVVAPKPAPVPPPVPAPKPAPVPPPAPVPAPAPAPKPVTPPPAPAPAPAPVVASSNGVSEVSDAVHAWASAWSRRDMDGYLAAYTPDYATGGKSHKAWEEDRKARIVPRKRIAVQVADLRVSVNGDKAQVHFKQIYESDTLSTTGHKTLELVRSPAGKWLIKQESVGG